MKLLVIGATGQVGLELVRATRHLDGRVVTTRSGTIDADTPCLPLDVARLDEVRRVIQSVAPDVLINASAYTAVDRAESEPETAFRINAEAVAVMADACRQAGTRLVHYSTDYVFDGSASTPYNEEAPTQPLGIYGTTKRAGEEAIISARVDHLILRTAWVYATHGHNFLRTMLRLGASRDELRVVNDQIGCPTPASWIATTTVDLVTDVVAPSGIINVVADSSTSWHGFAEAIFERAVVLGVLPRAPRVEPITTDEYPTPAPRPAYSVLDTARLRSLGIVPPSWRAALSAEMVKLNGLPAGMR